MYKHHWDSIKDGAGIARWDAHTQLEQMPMSYQDNGLLYW
jgi:hypothetical protein